MGTWFVGILRGQFSAAVSGSNIGFAEIAHDSLGRLIAEHGISAPVAAVEAIMGTFKNLEVHPDVVPGSRPWARSPIW